MVTYIFNGECPSGIKQAFIDTYLPKLELVVETTADYKKSGIYWAERNHASMPIVINWGDGTVEQVDGDVSQKVHEYATVGTFNVVVKNIKSYAASANNSTWYNTTSQNSRTLKEVVAMPDNVTSIGNYAFYNCVTLTSVAISNGMTSIGNYAFSWCRGLMSVMIPNSVTSIGSSVFTYCESLSSVTITGNDMTKSENVKQMMISAGVSSSIDWHIGS